MIRTVVAALLAILLVPVLVVANVSTWSLRTVVDDETFATTLGRTLDTPAIESLFAREVAEVVMREVAEAGPAVRLVAADVLGLSRAATPDALETAVEARVLQAVQDPRVEAARTEAVEAVHAFVFDAARGSGDLVRIDGEDVVVDLYPIVERTADVIDARLVAVIQGEVDAGSATIVVASADGVRTVQTVVVVLDTLRWVIPLLVVLATILILVVAHRRARALGFVGVAVMLAGLISLAVVWIGGVAGPSSIDDLALQELVAEIYGELTSVLISQSVLLLAIGAALLGAAWWWRRTHRPVAAGVDAT